MEIAKTTLALTEQIEQEYAASQRCAEDAVMHAINVGVLLREAKKLVGHGEWLGYLEDNFEFRHTTAMKYMSLAENQDRILDSNCHRGVNLSIREALRLIADETPKERKPRVPEVPVEIIPPEPQPEMEMHVPGRAGAELGEIERGGGDEGETGIEPPERPTQQAPRKPEKPPVDTDSLEDVDPEFRDAWRALLGAITNARATKWRAVPKETALRHVRALEDLITAR